ncbi:uncharacterized protein BP5553_00158 [Venustampulla echinocandica]|uniref:2EXR domain-containing protein n=1 Tax=Venustampulla echinocandica TaxID=2656787 RepID=A0A370TXE1_9HELO|nr:uncharacterized protein BP5553_00158 [Venustampulla echinocandica]RDL40179.1 hypothetical protein BP5553_00158 [Venustampulla echinocandica]
MQQENILSSPPLVEGVAHGNVASMSHGKPDSPPFTSITKPHTSIDDILPRHIQEYNPPPFEALVPKELREIIWKYLLPGPRIVRIDMAEHPIRAPADRLQLEAVTDSNPVPTPIFHICSESRKLALKHYECAFKEQLSGKPIYFDFEIDTLYFPNPVELCAFNWFIRISPHMAISQRRDTGWHGKLKFLSLGSHYFWCEGKAIFRELVALEMITREEGVARSIAQRRGIRTTRPVHEQLRSGVMDSFDRYLKSFWAKEIAAGHRATAPEHAYLTSIQLQTKADMLKHGM